MTGTVRAELEGHIGFLTFDNQVRRNAVSLKMWEELGEGLEGFAKDDNARVVVLRGAGDKAFIAGADISQFDDHRKDADGTKNYDAVSGRATHLLATFPKPTIAKIQGYCIGGGLAIALGCDIRIASEDSTFAIPAASLGLVMGPPVFVPWCNWLALLWPRTSSLQRGNFPLQKPTIWGSSTTFVQRRSFSPMSSTIARPSLTMRR